MRNETFYRFQAAANGSDTAELFIYDAIGDWEELGEVSAKGFARDLAALPGSVKNLDIHINSPGGSVFDASAIYSRLADHRTYKTIYIDGLAASAATIIAMVGHKIYVRSNATMMIHMPSGIVMGTAKDMRDTAGALDSITESMLNVYEKRTGKDREDIRNMLDAETWMTPDQAVEHGFADEVRGVVKAAASLGDNRYSFNGQEFDLSRFQKVPAFNATKTTKQKHNMEKPTANADGGGEPAAAPASEPTPAPQPTPTPSPAPSPTPAPAPAATGDDPIVKERSRVAALMKADKPATHALVQAAIADGRSIADIAAELVEAMDKASNNSSNRSARHADARQLENIPAADAGEDAGEENGFGALIVTKVKDRLKQRGLTAAHGRN